MTVAEESTGSTCGKTDGMEGEKRENAEREKRMDARRERCARRLIARGRDGRRGKNNEEQIVNQWEQIYV